MSKYYDYPKYGPHDACRFCNHNAATHIEVIHFGTGDIAARWNKCERADYPLGCKCPGFGPVDNLEYLEEICGQ